MRTLEKTAFGLFVVVMVVLLVAIATALQGCSVLHPSDRKPDAEWLDDSGHKYYGWRAGKKRSVAHAGDCPHPSHVRMQPDTVYVNQIIQKGGL